MKVLLLLLAVVFLILALISLLVPTAVLGALWPVWFISAALAWGLNWLFDALGVNWTTFGRPQA